MRFGSRMRTLAFATFVFVGCAGGTDASSHTGTNAAIHATSAAPATSAPATSTTPAAPDRRDAFRRPAELLALLELHPGDRVADVGAGDGYLTYRLASAVGPTGRVVATDVELGALMRLVQRVSTAHARTSAPIELRRALPATPGLEAASYDLVLLAEVDQYLPDRAAYFRALLTSLAPQGRLVVVNRVVYRGHVLTAARAAGFVVRSESSALPGQVVLVLVPGASP